MDLVYMEGKQTKHAEFSYLVKKFISDAPGSRYRFVVGISHTMTEQQTALSVHFDPVEIFKMFKTSHWTKQTSPDITWLEVDSQDKKQTKTNKIIFLSVSLVWASLKSFFIFN